MKILNNKAIELLKDRLQGFMIKDKTYHITGLSGSFWHSLISKIVNQSSAILLNYDLLKFDIEKFEVSLLQIIHRMKFTKYKLKTIKLI